MEKKKVICIANQKGGIGKTTTATALASILNEMGHKTLLIDADSQGNSTDTYRAERVDVPTLYDVILDFDDPLPIMEAIQHTEIGDIIASDTALKEADMRFPSDGDEYFKLKEALDQLEGYKYVVIDTAPADNKLLKNCLVASDCLVIPITSDRYAVQGLADFNKTILVQRKRNNPDLKVAGLLLVKYNPRQRLAREVSQALGEISEKMGTKVFRTSIRESVKARTAQAQRRNLIETAPYSTTALDYKRFANELFEEGIL